MLQATSTSAVLHGVQQYGVAPGARKLMDWEEQAAQQASETGIYVTWRNQAGQDCTRVGPDSRCFCGHSYSHHKAASKRSPLASCSSCSCRDFAFIPQRPEEVGEWWLSRRKGFNVHTWRARCKCGHGHDQHDTTTRRCSCGCSHFHSNFLCVACDRHWEEHETVVETEVERRAAGRPVGEDFKPLASTPDIQRLVFPARKASVSSASKAVNPEGSSSITKRLQPVQVPPHQGEKSVRIMASSSGGAVPTNALANRWGKPAAPPPPTGSLMAAGQARVMAVTAQQGAGQSKGRGGPG